MWDMTKYIQSKRILPESAYSDLFISSVYYLVGENGHSEVWRFLRFKSTVHSLLKNKSMDDNGNQLQWLKIKV